MLFALDTERRVKRAQVKISQVIEDFEPRVTAVMPQFVIKRNNDLHVIINYTIKNGMPNQEVNMTLKRAR